MVSGNVYHGSLDLPGEEKVRGFPMQAAASLPPMKDRPPPFFQDPWLRVGQLGAKAHLALMTERHGVSRRIYTKEASRARGG